MFVGKLREVFDGFMEVVGRLTEELSSDVRMDDGMGTVVVVTVMVFVVLSMLLFAVLGSCYGEEVNNRIRQNQRKLLF